MQCLSDYNCCCLWVAPVTNSSMSVWLQLLLLSLGCTCYCYCLTLQCLCDYHCCCLCVVPVTNTAISVWLQLLQSLCWACYQQCNVCVTTITTVEVSVLHMFYFCNVCVTTTVSVSGLHLLSTLQCLCDYNCCCLCVARTCYLLLAFCNVCVTTTSNCSCNDSMIAIASSCLLLSLFYIWLTKVWYHLLLLIILKCSRILLWCTSTVHLRI